MKHFTVYLTVGLLLVAPPAMADAFAGAALLTDVRNLLEGSMGTLVGLAISLYGFYRYIIEQAGWGLMMIVGGTLVTAFPSVFKSVHQGAVTALGGTLQNTQTSPFIENL